MQVQLYYKPLVYGYSFARIRAKNRLLISKAQMEAMLGLGTIDEIVAKLEETAYKPELVELSIAASGGTLVDLALGRNFGKLVGEIMGFAPEMARPALNSFLDIYTVRNLAVLLRGLARNMQKADLDNYLIPAGSLDVALIKRFDQANPEKSLLGLASNAYGRVLYEEFVARGRSADELAKNAEAVIARLYQAYNKNALSNIKLGERDAQKLRKLMESRIESRDVMMLARGLRMGMAFEKLEGYFALPNPKYKEYYKAGKADFDSLMRKLDAQYSLGAYEKYSQDKFLSHYEIAFEQRFARLSAGAFRRSVMSLGSLLGFIFLKEQEVMNVRKIAWGKLLKLKPAGIEEMLVFPERVRLAE